MLPLKIGLDTEDVNAITRTFRNFTGVDEAIVFGSRASGNFKKGSDIDMALKGKNLNLVILNEISDKLDDLYLPYIFDLSIFAQITNSDLIDHINRVGLLFYKKN